ncbi:MAG: precorrin-6Y C5,15-methyltransferase (decarboxylating) subunit CbiT, partial [Clostridia bacterium]|nr:precorrin-6Y C5,15-methyltransferase (decarboxylating) subunit CbiT [Clostridia bacterium]
AALVAQENALEFAVLVSGDVGFYSAAAGLSDALAGHRIRFIPGISTVSFLFARLKLPWQEAALVSAHGRDTDIAGYVRRNRLTFCLTGNNASELGAALSKAGFGHIQTYVGENLGSENERVYETVADDLTRGGFPSLTVLLFVNEAFDNKTPCGLPDNRFFRLAGIPMTKSDTRAIVLSKLNLNPVSIAYDIGAGTGSVTVEMALSAYRGHVYAVERREEAISLIEKNCAAFHIGNVTAVCGEAPAALEPLPAPDAVFIGGSGGGIDELIRTVLRKNPDARIVVTAVTLETVSAALAAFAKAGQEPEIVQVSIARGKLAGGLHLMEAQNPVTILHAGGKL